MVDESGEMVELIQAIVKGDLSKISSLLDSGSVSVKSFVIII